MHRLLQIPALLFLFASTSGAHPESESSDTLELPVYKSEEAAAADLRSRLEKLSKKSDVSIESSKELISQFVGDFYCARRKVQAVGKSKELMTFAAALDDPAKFTFVADFELKPNHRDPKILETRAVLNSWYARDGEGSKKTLEWIKRTNPPRFAFDVFYNLVELMPEEGVRLKRFSIRGDRVVFLGESKSLKAANNFGSDVFEALPLEYSWRWQKAPEKSTTSKDEVFDFSIVGTRLEPKEPPTVGSEPEKQ